jgi:glycosyltransferase involved in cell wall biosynthesis
MSVEPCKERLLDFPIDMSGKKIVISEEALTTEVGHFYEYNRAVVEIARFYGADPLVAVHKDANGTVLSGLPAKPVYSRTSWGTINTEPNPVKRHTSTLAHNLRISRTMSKLLKETGPVDVLFAPTVTIHHLLGFYLLALQRMGRDFNRMVLLTRNTIATYEGENSKPQFKAQAIVFAKLIQSMSKRYSEHQFTFATDSDRLADEYEVLCRLRPVVFPSPRIAPARLVKPWSGKTVKFVSLGPARFEKGIDILEAAVSKLLSSSEMIAAARFVIQWNQAIYRGPELILPDGFLKAHPLVRYITEEMSSHAYDNELYDADCIVLPYRQSSYFARISGVAVEAATAGIPIIYTLNTWCEDFVKKSGAGIGVPDGDADALADAIRTMTHEAAAFRAAASLAARRAREANSAESFARLLFAGSSPAITGTVDAHAL